jgi:hypothetical protein
MNTALLDTPVRPFQAENGRPSVGASAEKSFDAELTEIRHGPEVPRTRAFGILEKRSWNYNPSDAQQSRSPSLPALEGVPDRRHSAGATP